MPLDAESIQQIEAIFRRVLLSSTAPAAPVSRKLTVEEFAYCIQRSPEFVRRKIRAAVIPRDCVEGKKLYLIHVRALEKFRVTPEMAAKRLQEWREQTQAEPAQPSRA